MLNFPSFVGWNFIGWATTINGKAEFWSCHLAQVRNYFFDPESVIHLIFFFFQLLGENEDKKKYSLGFGFFGVFGHMHGGWDFSSLNVATMSHQLLISTNLVSLCWEI